MTANTSDTDSNVVSKQHEPSWRLTTKISVSGQRFLRRRLEHAIVRRNTAMWDDPPRFYSRATTYGVIATAVICVAAVLLAHFKPQGSAGADRVLKDTATGQLFVLDNNIVRPVYNLTSARLITGQHNQPRAVKPSQLAAHRRGQIAGIPGAPYDTPALAGPNSYWTVCDTAEHPTSTYPTLDISVLADKPTYSPATSTPLAGTQTVIASYHNHTYLIDSDGRHALDLTNTAVDTAINLPPETVPTPLSEALYNALPAAAPLTLPEIPAAGDPNTFGMDPKLTIGTVITDTTTTDKQFYVITTNGVAKINPATAAALRNTNTYGHLDPPIVPADTITAAPPATYPSPLHDITRGLTPWVGHGICG